MRSQGRGREKKKCEGERERGVRETKGERDVKQREK